MVLERVLTETQISTWILRNSSTSTGQNAGFNLKAKDRSTFSQQSSLMVEVTWWFPHYNSQRLRPVSSLWPLCSKWYWWTLDIDMLSYWLLTLSTFWFSFCLFYCLLLYSFYLPFFFFLNGRSSGLCLCFSLFFSSLFTFLPSPASL